MIDNNSSPPLSSLGPLEAHPRARIVREDRQGLAHARLRGFRETDSDLIVMVDDDNILTPEYLVTALDISKQWPVLGLWGGQCIPEFEVEPEEWTTPYWSWLAIHQFDSDRWSNLPYHGSVRPCGAGMCLRRVVVNEYIRQVSANPARAGLGRNGTQLTGGEDDDLSSISCALGLGNGQLCKLQLTHIMPRRRLEQDYLLALVEAQTKTSVLMRHYNGLPTPSLPARSERLLRWYERLRLGHRDCLFEQAKQRGIEAALHHIEATAKRMSL